ncbi:hypothetical protein AHAS_Ahas16G0014300 [Arachis hypogaea]
MKIMIIIIRCRVVLTAMLALFLVFLLFSSFFQSHDHHKSSKEISLSRKLLSQSMDSIISTRRVGKLSGSKKQNKKVVFVQQSLRKAPPSVPNPTQNK